MFKCIMEPLIGTPVREHTTSILCMKDTVFGHYNCKYSIVVGTNSTIDNQLLEVPLLEVPLYVLEVPLHLLEVPLYILEVALYILEVLLYVLEVPLYLLEVPL